MWGRLVSKNSSEIPKAFESEKHSNCDGRFGIPWVRQIDSILMKRSILDFLVEWTTYSALLLLIASASKSELARQIQYLKVENDILRGKLPARITVTGKERSRLVKLATAIHGLATIVTPNTVIRWIKEDRAGKSKVAVERGRLKRYASWSSNWPGRTSGAIRDF